MIVTYINHSGFFVELDTVCLLFDYWQGALPEPVRGKPLLAFASHSHMDHFNPEIFAYAARWEQAQVVLGSDIRLSAKRKETLGIRDEDFVRLGPDRRETVQGVGIRTLRSTDKGVAFLVEAEGRTIYHAGDLNWWLWEAEPEDAKAVMTEKFLTEMEKLKGISIDVAFLTLDARQQNTAHLGFDYCLRNLDIKKAVPMHSFGKYEMQIDFAVGPMAQPYREKILLMTESGKAVQL